MINPLQTSISQQKIKISDLILSTLMNVEGVLSVTIVGSFNDRDELLVISDIDTIVIVDKLTKDNYEDCINAIKGLDGKAFGFPDRSIFVNSTFGPLKFDNDSNIVVHLMIYDVEGHKKHVIQSPFTCFDWERSELYRGKRLGEIYPVLKLQPHDFKGARRGIQNYLDDLDKGAVSYRSYEFQAGGIQEITQAHILDVRHQGEYAFHIVKNLVVNYCKLMSQKNIYCRGEELEGLWRRYLPQCSYFIEFFNILMKIKDQRGSDFPPQTIDEVKIFIQHFEQQFQFDWNDVTRIHLVRHGKTALNDGRFLGCRQDPSILESPESLGIPYIEILTSPMRRAIETARSLGSRDHVLVLPELSEIDYGDADGLSFSELQGAFPEMNLAWMNQEDPRFPNGENNEDVISRFNNFINRIESQRGLVLAVSHNVFIRCGIGKILNIPPSLWYKIQVPHLSIFEIVIKHGQVFSNLDRETKQMVIDSIVS
jgi:ribonuclease H / adenosylcobalamin/alpha-ribazole phosphatase